MSNTSPTKRARNAAISSRLMSTPPNSAPKSPTQFQIPSGLQSTCLFPSTLEHVRIDPILSAAIKAHEARNSAKGIFITTLEAFREVAELAMQNKMPAPHATVQGRVLWVDYHPTAADKKDFYKVLMIPVTPGVASDFTHTLAGFEKLRAENKNIGNPAYEEEFLFGVSVFGYDKKEAPDVSHIVPGQIYDVFNILPRDIHMYYDRCQFATKADSFIAVP
jgi:hypothetical protein